MKSLWLPGIVIASSFGMTAPVVLAQYGSGGQHGAGTAAQHPQAAASPALQVPAYDTRTEATLTGTVENVTTTDRSLGPGGGMGMGTQERQFTLKTGTGTIDVRLGPHDFVNKQKVRIAQGDTVEVIGSRVTVGESEVVLARELRKGAASWTLRDATGQPRWDASRGQHR